MFVLQGDLQLQVKLHGSNAIGARFGTTIKNVGDLNKDGYKGNLKGTLASV